MRALTPALLLMSLLLLGVAPSALQATTTTSSEQSAVQVIGPGQQTAESCVPSQEVVCDPFSTAFDSKGDLWIADGSDSRVMEFPLIDGHISSNASVVLGQDNFTGSACGSGAWPNFVKSETLCFPDGLAFDSAGDLWVSDGGGSRVVEYPLVNGAISTENKQIIGPNFTAAAPSTPSLGMMLPVGIAFDKAGDLWVTDLSYSRVLEFPLVGGSIAIAPSREIGQGNMSGSSCNQSNEEIAFQNATARNLCLPSDIAFDQKGDLWVSDFGEDPYLPGNSRVVMFPSVDGQVSEAATTVIGQDNVTGEECNQGQQAPTNDTLCYPVSIAFDDGGDLWVDDAGNSRVVEFPTSGSTISPVASQVLGQGNFTADQCNMGGAAPNDTTLCRPLWIAFDSHNDLWVSDTDNLRVLEFQAPPSAASGALILELAASAAIAIVAVAVGAVILMRRRRKEIQPQPVGEPPTDAGTAPGDDPLDTKEGPPAV